MIPSDNLATRPYWWAISIEADRARVPWRFIAASLRRHGIDASEANWAGQHVWAYCLNGQQFERLPPDAPPPDYLDAMVLSHYAMSHA